MFADALLDSHHQSRRGWATLTSFGVQAVAVACLLIVPLFYIQVLPRVRVMPPIVVSPWGDTAQRPPAAQPTPAGRPSIFTVAQPGALIAPNNVPRGIVANPGDVEAPTVFMGGGTGTRFGTPDGILGVPETIATRPILQPPAVSKPPIISRMMEGSLIHRVEPVYPPLAITARIQGTVALEAVIGGDGAVKNLQVLRGHPLLIPAAINAVKQWRYRPYLLNGVPVEVDTHVTVNFILTR